MKVFTLYNADSGNMETVALNSQVEAFELAMKRNRKERSQPWRAYDEHGYRIFGLFQDNESGRVEGIVRA